MSWRNKLRSASFRGVQFEVEATDRGAGRRLQVHEYPLRDEPYTEDLGRAARNFSIEGFLVGDDYLPRLNRLLKALEAPGPGTLVHPYYGAMQVCVDGQGTRVIHTKDEGRMCRFFVSFVEAGRLSNPSIAPSIGGQLLSAASKLLSVAGAGFIKRYLVESLPAFVPAAAKAFFASKGIEVTAELDSPTIVADVVSWSEGLDLPAAVAVVSDSYDIPTNTATPAREQIRENVSAAADLVKQSAIAQLATQVVEADWAIYDDAVAAMNEYSGYIDEAMDSADDEAYHQLSSVRVLLVKHIRRELTSAVRLTSYEPLQPMPALAVAHRLYGDASRDSEIVKRNGVRHPGFVSGPMQVLEG